MEKLKKPPEYWPLTNQLLMVLAEVGKTSPIPFSVTTIVGRKKGGTSPNTILTSMPAGISTHSLTFKINARGLVRTSINRRTLPKSIRKERDDAAYCTALIKLAAQQMTAHAIDVCAVLGNQARARSEAALEPRAQDSHAQLSRDISVAGMKMKEAGFFDFCRVKLELGSRLPIPENGDQRQAIGKIIRHTQSRWTPKPF